MEEGKCCLFQCFSVTFHISSLLDPRLNRKSFLVHHVAGHPKALISAPRGEERGPRRDLWGAMSKDTEEQPSRKSFTSRHAPLLDISYWLDAAADRTDLIHHTIIGVSYWSEDRWQIKHVCITLCIWFVFWFTIKLKICVKGLNNKRTTNNFLHLLDRFFFSWSVISPMNFYYGIN